MKKWILIFLLVLSYQVIAQKDEMLVACKGFLLENERYLNDFSLDSAELSKVSADSMLHYFVLLQNYWELKEYFNVTFLSTYVKSVEITDTGNFCYEYYTHGDSLAGVYEMQQEDGVWKVGRFIQIVSFEAVNKRLEGRIQAEKEKLNEIKDIEAVVSEFAYGLEELKLNNNTSRIQKTTTTLAFKVALIQYEIDTLSTFRNKLEIRSIEFVSTKYLNDTVAETRYKVNNDISRYAVVQKQSGRWLVAGEQEVIDQEYLIKKQQELAWVKEKIKIQGEIKKLSFALEDVLVRGKFERLDLLTTPDMSALLKRFINKTAFYDPRHFMIHEEIISDKLGFGLFNAIEKGDTIIASVYSCKLQYIKTGDDYRLCGLNNFTTEKAVSSLDLEIQFEHFINLLDCHYSLFEDNTVVKENDDDVEITWDFGESNYWDSLVYNCFEYMEKPPMFVGGPEAMYEFIDKNLVNNSGENGRVYVGFIVEKNGQITKPRIISSPSETLSDAALSVVSFMPPWLPAEDRSGTVYRYGKVIEISFD